MLNFLRALVLSLVMFTSIPLTQAGGPIIYPPVDTQPRAVEAFVSSERGVNVGTAVTYLLRAGISCLLTCSEKRSIFFYAPY